MIGIPLGLLTANATEWVFHKYVLHGLGRKKGSFWGFHWHEHHAGARKFDFDDPDYHHAFWESSAHRKEAFALMAGAAMGIPLFPIAPFFVGTLWYSSVNYYRVHKRSHLDPDWAREHLPWHYDHHMAPNQHANWCVTKPWFDHIMGTREPYLGTERAIKDDARRAKRLARRAKKAAQKMAEVAGLRPVTKSTAQSVA